MDGHGSHYEPSSVELAKENDVTLFCLPPHTPQDSQPLDCTVFGPLKRHWSNVCHKYLQSHPGAIVNKYNFCEFFSEAWLFSVTSANIVSGFRKCGIYPFNRDAIPTCENGFEATDSETTPEALGDSRSGDSPGSADLEITPNGQVDSGSGDSPRSPDLRDDGVRNSNFIAACTSTHTLSSPSECQQYKFSEDQVALFEKRFEEGYNIYVDDKYLAWLKLNHPDVVPVDKFSPTVTSVADAFGDVSPLHSIAGSHNLASLLMVLFLILHKVMSITHNYRHLLHHPLQQFLQQRNQVR